MTKQEISELRRRFHPNRCTITRVCGCLVDGEKEKRMEFCDAFLSLPEEDAFKYFDIFKKGLSGSLGKNLINLDFPLAAEEPGGTQEFLYRLQESRLTDADLRDQFYQKVIESYATEESYMILLIHDAYDVPGRGTDGLALEDASEEVYDYILCCICPLSLTKAGLGYSIADNCLRNRTRDWIVEMPVMSFLYPAFNDRSADIHSLLFYTRDPSNLHRDVTDALFGCPAPLPAPAQKETFQSVLTEALGADCDYEIIRNIHDHITERLEDHAMKEIPEPLLLEKRDMAGILSDSGATEEAVASFTQLYGESPLGQSPLYASNLVNPRSFEVKMPDVSIRVKPERSDLISSMEINGKKCLVIEISDTVQVNGMPVQP